MARSKWDSYLAMEVCCDQNNSINLPKLAQLIYKTSLSSMRTLDASRKTDSSADRCFKAKFKKGVASSSKFNAIIQSLFYSRSCERAISELN